MSGFKGRDCTMIVQKSTLKCVIQKKINFGFKFGLKSIFRFHVFQLKLIFVQEWDMSLLLREQALTVTHGSAENGNKYILQ